MSKLRTVKIYIFLIITASFISCSKDSGPSLPELSILSLPSNGENCNSGNSVSDTEASVQFSWTNTSDVSYFMLEINNLETQQKTTSRVIPSGDSNSIVTSKNLIKGYPYEWYVTSHSEDYPDDIPSSSKWRFYLQGNAETNSPPFPANLLSPNSGEAISLNDNGLVNLLWEGIDPENDNLIYTLYLDTFDGFQSPIDQYTNLASPNLLVSLQANNVYYWRIFTEDSFGNNSISQVQSFRVLDN
jgi:hypothetical protein